MPSSDTVAGKIEFATPSAADFKSVLDGIVSNSNIELLNMEQHDLERYWHFSWSDNCDFAMNLYRFHKAVKLYGNFCRRWEEMHNGTCCVVERVRDKYLLPKFQMLIEMVNFSPEEHCRNLNKLRMIDAYDQHADTAA